MPKSVRFSVVNPEGRLVQTTEQAPCEPNALAPRLDTLDGKVVYLVDTGFGGSFKFMRELENWFSANMPSVKTVRTRKPGGPFSDDNDALWEEIKKRGDAAVLGVGG